MNPLPSLHQEASNTNVGTCRVFGHGSRTAVDGSSSIPGLPCQAFARCPLKVFSYLSTALIMILVFEEQSGCAGKKTKGPRVQTMPPSIPVADLFPDGIFPECERQSYKDE